MKSSTNIAIVGVDLSKNVFQIHAQDKRGNCIMRKRLKRDKFLEYFINLPKCIVAMEACGGAHHWARRIQQMGHDVRIIAPKFVKPFVLGNKDDAADAEAIAAASSSPRSRFVAVKEESQQEMSMIHTTRELLVRQRTATRNSIRGMLAEYGIVFPKGAAAFRKGVEAFLSESSSRLPIVRGLVQMRYQDLLRMEEEIGLCDMQIQKWCREDDRCKLLLQIPGVGPITATALVAHMGSPHVFKNGRHFAAYLGLVPKHVGTGGKTINLGISKRGDRYLRKLLVHGARSVVNSSRTKQDKVSSWVQKLAATRGVNKACVALANKNARRSWAALKYGRVD
jgi:transposase